MFYSEFPNISRALKSGRFTVSQIEEMKDFFELTDGELEGWLDDEGESEVYKIYKAISDDEEEDGKKPYEYGEEVAEPGKMRDGLEAIRQLARNIPEKTLRAQIVGEVDRLLKQLGVIQKSTGYDARSGMTESPEIAYLKAKMRSAW